MLERTPEPELMDETEQALAYAEADFSEPNALFIELIGRYFPDLAATGHALDLGCGPADIPIRLAGAYRGWQIDAVDGAESMLALARTAVGEAGLGGRIRLIHAYLPDGDLRDAGYDAIYSNSLLHHLADPLALWRTVRRCAAAGAAVQVMDLERPSDSDTLEDLVARYAADAPEVLRHDFRCSLHAAYTVDEVRAQLAAEGLAGIEVERVSDRHLAAHGRVAG